MLTTRVAPERTELGARPRWVGPAGAAVVLTIAAALVALASRAPLSRATPVNAAAAGTPVDALYLLILGAGVAGLVALAVIVWPGPPGKEEDERREPYRPDVHPLLKAAMVALPFALGAALVVASQLALTTRRRPGLPPGSAFVPHPRGRLGGHAAGSGGGFIVPSWLPWTVAGIVVAGLVATGLLLWMRRERDVVLPPSERGAARAAVQAGIDALTLAGDARGAVIAAYVAMLGALAQHGLSRSRHEAPREYLRRVLAQLSGAGREAEHLTRLFEEARYSTHPLSERARETAHTHLRTLRERLEAAGAR